MSLNKCGSLKKSKVFSKVQKKMPSMPKKNDTMKKQCPSKRVTKKEMIPPLKIQTPINQTWKKMKMSMDRPLGITNKMKRMKQLAKA
jgi:hypothetical protein